MSDVRFLDAGHQAEFDREGFVKLRLMERGAALELGAQLARVLDPALANMTSGDELAGHYFSMGFAEHELAARANMQAREALIPLLKRHFHHCRLVMPSALVKLPNAPHLPIHTHPVCAVEAFAVRAICWLALGDADGSSGAIRLVPRAHRLSGAIRALGAGDYYEAFRDEIERRATTVPVEAGEALFMDDTLPHGSAAMNDGPVRIAIGGVVIGRDCEFGCTRAIDGRIEWVRADEADLAAYSYHQQMPASGEIVRSGPDGARGMTLAEFEALMQAQRKATADFDPLAELRRAAMPAPAPAPNAATPFVRRVRRKVKRVIRKAAETIAPGRFAGGTK